MADRARFDPDIVYVDVVVPDLDAWGGRGAPARPVEGRGGEMGSPRLRFTCR